MFKMVQKYLERIAVPYQIRENKQVFDFEVDAPEGHWACMLLLCGRSGIAFYSVLPFKVPEENRSELALYLMQINNERIFGNFELDQQTGEVRFKTYIDTEAQQLSERMLDRCLLINVSCMQKFLPRIKSKIKQYNAQAA